MRRLIKTLPCQNGELFIVTRGRRIILADCSANVEVYEHSISVPILGRGNVIDKRYASLLVTFGHKPENAGVEDFADNISRIEFTGDVINGSGVVERLTFDNCMLDGDLDLTQAGTCVFELRCTVDMLNKLRAM